MKELNVWEDCEHTHEQVGNLVTDRTIAIQDTMESKSANLTAQPLPQGSEVKARVKTRMMTKLAIPRSKKILR